MQCIRYVNMRVHIKEGLQKTVERNKVNRGSLGLEKDPARDVLRRTLKEIERNEGGKKKMEGSQVPEKTSPWERETGRPRSI